MRLHDLTIENFRSFEHYRLDGLARVNLLVGENNCGKTSVLEAGFLLTSSYPLDAIVAVTTARGETCRTNLPSANQQLVTVPTVDSLFLRRGIGIGSTFRIEGDAANSEGAKQAKFVAMIEEGSGPYAPVVVANSSWRLHLDWTFGEVKHGNYVWMASDGAIFTQLQPSGYGSGGSRPSGDLIALSGWGARELASRWDKVLQRGESQSVVNSLRVLHPRIRDVVFLPSMIGVSERLGGIMIQLENEKKPVPLNSIGDGSQRLLVMASAASSNGDGTLFIDEIDTGLHYSKLPDMWRMMIMAAIRNNVQITATTHSLDCIRALAMACDDDESFRDEVALFSIDRRMDEAVRYGGEELSSVVAHEIEVR